MATSSTAAAADAAFDGNALALREYFSGLDGEFHGINKVVDDTFSYNGTGVQIQNTWELPIVIQWPDSSIKFRFTTTPGDIHFGIAFVPALDEGQSKDDMKVEMIENVGLVSSSTMEIEGAFGLSCEGVVIFMWDNNYDWTAIKKLSYVVEVYEPSFLTIDTDRAEVAYRALQEVTEQTEILHSRLADAEDYTAYHNSMAAKLEEEILVTSTILQDKLLELKELETELLGCESVVVATNRRVPGLAIRTLNNYLLSKVFEYLNVDGGINSVCYHWYTIAQSLRHNITIKDEIRPTELELIATPADRKAVLTDLKAKRYVTVDVPIVDADIFRNSLMEDDSPVVTPRRSVNSLLQVAQERSDLNILGTTTAVDPTMTVSPSNTPVKGKHVVTSVPKPQSPTSAASAASASVLVKNLARLGADARVISMASVIDNNVTKLEVLEAEKRRIKKALKSWNATFEREQQRLPTNHERKELAGQLYEEYQKVSLTLRVRQDKIDDMLVKIPMAKADFELLRTNPEVTLEALSAGTSLK